MNYTLRVLTSVVLIAASADLDAKSKKVDPCSYTQVKNGVTLSFATVSKEECKRCFGAINKKYLPLKIQVSSKDKHILLTSDQLEIFILSINDIMKRRGFAWPAMLGMATLTIGIPFAIIGSVIGGLWYTFGGGGLISLYGATAVGCVPLVGGTALTIKSSQWSSQNPQEMICHTILTSEYPLEVAPNTQETRYIFIKTKDFKPEFKVSILDKSTQKNIDFDVHMKSECVQQN